LEISSNDAFVVQMRAEESRYGDWEWCGGIC